MGCGGRDRRLVQQIDMLRPCPRSAKAMHPLERAFLKQGRLQRATDTAGCADNDGATLCSAAHGCVHRTKGRTAWRSGIAA